jgi:hypothetical protein
MRIHDLCALHQRIVPRFLTDCRLDVDAKDDDVNGNAPGWHVRRHSAASASGLDRRLAPGFALNLRARK